MGLAVDTRQKTGGDRPEADLSPETRQKLQNTFAQLKESIADYKEILQVADIAEAVQQMAGGEFSHNVSIVAHIEVQEKQEQFAEKLLDLKRLIEASGLPLPELKAVLHPDETLQILDNVMKYANGDGGTDWVSRMISEEYQQSMVDLDDLDSQLDAYMSGISKYDSQANGSRSSRTSVIPGAPVPVEDIGQTKKGRTGLDAEAVQYVKQNFEFELLEDETVRFKIAQGKSISSVLEELEDKFDRPFLSKRQREAWEEDKRFSTPVSSDYDTTLTIRVYSRAADLDKAQQVNLVKSDGKEVEAPQLMLAHIFNALANGSDLFSGKNVRADNVVLGLDEHGSVVRRGSVSNSGDQKVVIAAEVERWHT